MNYLTNHKNTEYQKRHNSWRFSSGFNRGFTLVETLVAISIIMVGLTAAFSVAQMGVSSSSLAKDRVTAFFLAQEAFEGVKNVRDHNLLLNNAGTPTHWLENLTRVGIETGRPCGTTFATACDYDLNHLLTNSANLLRRCSDNGMNNCTLKHRTFGGSGRNSIKFYGYGGGGGSPLSRFSRKIIIEELPGNVEARVTVRVTWGAGPSKTLEVSNNLLNWF